MKASDLPPAPTGGSLPRIVRVWWDCPKCGAKPPTAHDLGGGPHFEGVRTCGNGCGTWESLEEWQAIYDANAEVSHRDRERQPAADQPSKQP